MAKSRRGVVLLAVMLAAFSLGGCSFMLLHPDRREHGPDGAPVCTRSWDGAVLDGIFTAASGGAALYMWSSNDSTRKAEAVGLGIASAIWLSSAIYALSDGIECTEQKGEYAPPPVHRARRGPPQPEP